MEKVEQAICIYMICLSVKISISYFAWKALDRNATTCMSQIRGTVGGALIEVWTIKPMRLYFTLLRCSGQDTPTITFTALEIHQDLPSSMTPPPLTNCPPGFLPGVQPQPANQVLVHSQHFLNTSAMEDVHLDVDLKGGRYLMRENKFKLHFCRMGMLYLQFLWNVHIFLNPFSHLFPKPCRLINGELTSHSNMSHCKRMALINIKCSYRVNN